MIGSALSYIALRLLGEGPDDGKGAVERARNWILDQGGAYSIPSWGKTYLAVKVQLVQFFSAAFHMIIQISSSSTK